MKQPFTAMLVAVLSVIGTQHTMAEQQYKYEYWLDGDYHGRHSGMTDAGLAVNEIDIAGMPPGVHLLSTRACNADGAWGVPDIKAFYIAPTIDGPIGLEYWIDGIYGGSRAGSGSDVLSFDIDIAGLKNGWHTLSTRTNPGGTVSGSLFYVRDNLQSITARYWVDDDLASAVTTPVSGAMLTFDLDISVYEPGIHWLNYQVQGSDGDWGGIYRQIFVNEYPAAAIAGYTYGFNGDRTTVKVSPSAQELTLAFDLPDLAETGNVEDGVMRLSGNTATMRRNVVTTFSLEMMSEYGMNTAPIGTTFEQKDTITREVTELTLDRQVTFAKPSKGDFEAFRFTVDGEAHYISTTQDCKIRIYRGRSSIQVEEFTDANSTTGHRLELASGTYYGVLYNSPVNEANPEMEVKVSLTYNDMAATPEITFDGGHVTITCATEDTSIYYTLDGSTPAPDNGTLYTEPFTLGVNATIKAIAVHELKMNSFVAELTIDSYNTAMPEIRLANGLITMTCATENSVIRFTVDGSDPTEGTVYTAPFIPDVFGDILAVASREGYNSSAVATLAAVDYVCPQPVLTYDGRDVTAQCPLYEANLYYTVDGTSPTTASALYTGALRLGGPATVKMLAAADDRLSLDAVTITADAYFDGREVTVAKPGKIAEAFGWCGASDIPEKMRVTGTIDMSDIAVVNGLAGIRHIDLKDASMSDNTIGDRAFAGTGYVSISLPSAVASCGNALFSGCERLAAIIWNVNSALPQSAFDEYDNPNMLLYVNRSQDAPATVANVISGNRAPSVTLSDVGESNDFYCPREFTADRVSYTRRFEMMTEPGVARGWETIALPFDVTTVTHEKQGACAPFADSDAISSGVKPFWLYEIVGMEYERSAAIKANTPYIISMPANTVYSDEYMLAGNVTFSAANARITATPTPDSTIRGGMPAFAKVHADESVFAINVGEEYEGRPEGSIFVSGLRDVCPFEAYMYVPGSVKRYIPIFDGDMSGLDTIEACDMTRGIKVLTGDHNIYLLSGSDCRVTVYTATGAIAAHAELNAGEISVVENLLSGLYIVAGQKVVLK